VTELVEGYRRNAEKCLDLVKTFNDPESRRSLLVMANAWLMLAAQREKSIETAPANEPPSTVNEPPPTEPPKPPPVDEPPKPPPINDPPPVNEPPPQRLNAARPDDPMQC